MPSNSVEGDEYKVQVVTTAVQLYSDNLKFGWKGLFRAPPKMAIPFKRATTLAIFCLNDRSINSFHVVVSQLKASLHSIRKIVYKRLAIYSGMPSHKPLVSRLCCANLFCVFVG